MKIKLLASSLILISFFFFNYSSYGAGEVSSNAISNAKRSSNDRSMRVKSARRWIASLERTFAEVLQSQWAQSSEEFEVFLDFFMKRKWGRALLQWDKSFSDTSFNTSPTGRAFYAYLLFKNNIKVMGMEMLFGIESPIEISQELKTLWHRATPYKNKVWNFVDIEWNDSWREIFDPEAEIITLLHNIFSIEEIESISKQHKLEDLHLLSQLQWNLILVLASQDILIEALNRLRNLMRLGRPPVSRELMRLTAARILFQLRSFDSALSYYKLIPKKSDYWLIAQEEIAWIHIQKNEPQKALGYTQTLMHPVLANQVGPEPSYLHVLASVKVCDYEEALRTINMFQINFEPKIKSLLLLKRQAGNTRSTVRLMQIMQGLGRNARMPISVFSLGEVVRKLPYLVNHDKFLFDLSRKRRILVLESRKIRRLSSVILSRGGGHSLRVLQKLRETIDIKLKKYNENFSRRIEYLASRDLDHIHQTIKKLHVAKSEVFHFITEKFLSRQVQEAYDKDKKLPQSTLEIKRSLYRESPYRLVFANKARELWFDELGNYRIHTNGCGNEAKDNKM